MLYLLVKSFHLIGFVCWFAGLFYIVRLFIYDIEASLKQEPDKSILINQFRIMEHRLWYGITVPSMVITTICGSWLLHLMPHLLHPQNYWMHLKLSMIVGLFGYHFKCGKILSQLKKGTCKKTSQQLRGFNEIATILLVGIVLAIITRSLNVTLTTLLSVFLIGGIIFKVYTKIRKK